MTTMPDHFGGVLAFQVDNGRLYVLVQPYGDKKYSGKLQIKFPGGTNKDADEVPLNETPRETATREFFEETNLKVRLTTKDEVYSREVVPGGHSKHFFATQSASGTARTEPMGDNGDTLHPPEWRQVTMGLRDSLYGDHQKALVDAVSILADTNEMFWYAARDLGLH